MERSGVKFKVSRFSRSTPTHSARNSGDHLKNRGFQENNNVSLKIGPRELRVRCDRLISDPESGFYEEQRE